MKLLLASFMILLCVRGFAQQNAAEQFGPRWQTKISYGVNIPLRAVPRFGNPVDDLISFNNEGAYWTLHSSSYFFTSRFGVEFTINGNTSGRISNDMSFTNRLYQTYQPEYFVKETFSSGEYGSSVLDPEITSIYFGPVFSYRAGRFIWTPKFLIGGMYSYNQSGRATLKQRNSHNVLLISYDAKKRRNANILISPAMSFGYQIGKRWRINADLAYTLSPINVIVTEETRNIVTETAEVRHFKYDKWLQTLSLGMGVAYSIVIRDETR
jgi:hypothetical protein